MPRFIDADALEQLFARNSITETATFADGRSIMQTLKDAPTIDAVPVVRCGNCTYFDTTGFDPDPDSAMLSMGYCHALRRNFQACDFCSHGVPRRKEKT